MEGALPRRALGLSGTEPLSCGKQRQDEGSSLPCLGLVLLVAQHLVEACRTCETFPHWRRCPVTGLALMWLQSTRVHHNLGRLMRPKSWASAMTVLPFSFLAKKSASPFSHDHVLCQVTHTLVRYARFNVCHKVAVRCEFLTLSSCGSRGVVPDSGKIWAWRCSHEQYDLLPSGVMPGDGIGDILWVVLQEVTTSLGCWVVFVEDCQAIWIYLPREV